MNMYSGRFLLLGGFSLLLSCRQATYIVLLNSVNPPDLTPVAPLVQTKKIAVGVTHVMAISSSGIAKSFGDNFESTNGVDGQLGLSFSGNGTRDTPQILDPGQNYLAVVSGEIQSCGITAGGRVKCWGALTGDGTGVPRNTPTNILDNGTDQYTDIVSGSYHICAINQDGILKCWGDGYSAKLGNGDLGGAAQNAPVVAMAGTRFKRIAAGRNHTCAITTSDKIQCWGDNGVGQIGDGLTGGVRSAAVDVDPGISYIEIAAGEDTSCGITTTGILKCWGFNQDGQLGDGSTVSKNSPTVIDSGVTYSKIALGSTYYFHTCGITTSGALKCWGNNSSGQLGNGSTTLSLVPVISDAGISYREISVSLDSSCGITSLGLLKCWGANGSGQLGIGGTAAQNSPVVVGTGY